MAAFVPASSSSSSSNIESDNRFPVANLGEEVLLSCQLTPAETPQVMGDVAVTWTKANLSGVVYKYKDGAPQLADQNPQFSRRTSVFPNAVARGNGSLLMAAVRRGDDGVYTCSIDADTRAGSVDIHLRTAVYSTLTFSVSGGTLTAAASRWQPQPGVTWLASNGTALHGITQFSRKPSGVYSFVSTLKQVGVDDVYTFGVQIPLVTGTSTVTITGSGVEVETRFSFSAGPSLSPSQCLVPLASLLIYAFGAT
ncbi:unnamed protein product [Merluccius merluccius]